MAAFGILSSRFHTIWSKAQGNNLGAGNQARYNATRTFQTYPFPEGLSPDDLRSERGAGAIFDAIAESAQNLHDLREKWLNPAELVQLEAEPQPSIPARLVPVDHDAARTLAARTLTALYGDRPAWLLDAQRAVDNAVAVAYGWEKDLISGGLDESEVLSRLFALNKERA
jgi:hypothetical protein